MEGGKKNLPDKMNQFEVSRKVPPLRDPEKKVSSQH
jgi:hypothetical protein